MDKNNYKIKDSYDFQYHRNLFIICLITSIFLILLTVFLKDSLDFIFILFVPILLGFTIFEGIVLFKMLKDYKNCQFYEADFTTFHSFIKYHYFVIKINIDGNEVEKYTRMIFNSLFFSKRNLENFANKKVLIGYNPMKQKVLTFHVIKD